MFAIGVIGAVLAAGGLAYSIYAGERARRAAAQSEADARNEIRLQQERDEQRLRQERIEAQELMFRQQAEQKATEDRLRAEQEASLQKVKGEVPGIQAQLGSDLLGQQEKAYAKMDPQIEARLNALGLLQSGALVEAKAKVQGDLESQRQAALADFGTNAAQRLQIDQPLANSSADVGRQYEGMQRNLDLDRSALSQRFASGATAAANDVARSQYLGGMSQATNAANQSAASSYLNASTQLGSGLIGYAASRQPSRNTSLDALYSSRNAYQPSSSYYYGSARGGRTAPR
jgi:hypothetical protein